MPNEIPISHASMPEVLARVAFRCIHWFDRNAEWSDSTPQDKMGSCAVWLAANGFKALGTWVLAYHVQWAPLMKTIDIRDDFIRRARQGHTWRRVAYPAYKSARRDPRVTNRGVTGTTSIEGE